jgi:hypothetical protein
MAEDKGRGAGRVLTAWDGIVPEPEPEGVFTFFKIPKILQDFSSHRIFRRMHEALNIGKKITIYTVWS